METEHGTRELWRINQEIEQQTQVVQQGQAKLNELEKQSKGAIS